MGIRTVSEGELDVTPDLSVCNIFLVARSDFSQFTVRRRLVSFSDTEALSLVLSSHGAVEASILSFVNNDGGFDGIGNGRNGESSESTGTVVELKEVSLLVRIPGETEQLCSFSENASSAPLVRLVSTNISE